MVRTLILIGGTWGDEWADYLDPGGFRRWLEAQGFRTIRFRWSGEVDGVPNPIGSVMDGDDNATWRAAGYQLRELLAKYPGAAVLTHSHGGAIPIYQATLPIDPCDACAVPVQPISALLTITCPPRKDLERLGLQALRAGTIRTWWHIYADGWDWWARIGQMFDGHWGWSRRFEVLDHPGFVQSGEPQIGHSGLFTEERRQLLIDHGYVEMLRGQLKEIA